MRPYKRFFCFFAPTLLLFLPCSYSWPAPTLTPLSLLPCSCSHLTPAATLLLLCTCPSSTLLLPCSYSASVPARLLLCCCPPPALLPCSQSFPYSCFAPAPLLSCFYIPISTLQLFFDTARVAFCGIFSLIRLPVTKSRNQTKVIIRHWPRHWPRQLIHCLTR